MLNARAGQAQRLNRDIFLLLKIGASDIDSWGPTPKNHSAGFSKLRQGNARERVLFFSGDGTMGCGHETVAASGRRFTAGGHSIKSFDGGGRVGRMD
jgi:hypothetical protein